MSIGLAEAQVVVNGTVVDENFQPVNGCRVVLRNADDGSVVMSLPTGANGRYVMSVPAGGRYAPFSVITANGVRVELVGYPLQVVAHTTKIDIQVPVVAGVAIDEGLNRTDRFYTAFVEDAQLPERSRFELAVRSREFDMSSHLLSEAIVAIQPTGMPQVEFGARIGYGAVDNDFGPDGGGLMDTDVWGKFVVNRASARAPRSAFGVVITLPTGDEDMGLGFDAMRSEIFGATRFNRDRHAWSLHYGVRVNENSEIGTATLEGEVAPVAGAAWMMAFRETIRVSLEARFEGARFEGGEDEAQVLVGWTWRAVENMKLRTAIGAGLADGSPDVIGQFGVAFDF
ncbi:MAG: carboxypeptidase-like regulatory domain-containing protein [Acidobacteriota bacterium]|nr:carboxypeptidase-like regulatory domain-containing protein [Acidobacteriota bacterium]MDH3783777.1 carboxypeptidase-like regulatory domain-containing protein [Acidobacteriota bacterium]